MISSARILLAVLLALILLSCGGGGGSGATGPKVVLDWPSLTRDITAPAYAGSAIITITPIVGRNWVTWTVDRPNGTAAQSVKYIGPSNFAATPSVLIVRFKSGIGGSGTDVASATAQIQISSDGTLLNSSGGPLGTISYSTNLNGLSITASDVNVDSTETISAVGQSNLGVVALPQDLINFSITSGNTFATLTKNQLRGVLPGNVTVQATYEGFKASGGLNVFAQGLSNNRFDFAANHIAVDLIHNKIWGTFGSTSAYPNTIVDLDVDTGSLGTPIPVGSEPDAIDITPDGNFAIIGLDGSQELRTVDLNLRTQGSTLYYTQIDPNTVPDEIKINPTNFNEVAISVRSLQNGAKRGPYILRNNGTTIAATANTDAFQTMLWISGTDIIRGQSGAGGSITRYHVTPTSVIESLNVVTNQIIYGDLKNIGNSRLVDDHGRVISSLTFANLAQFSSTDSFLATVGDPNHTIAYSAMGGTTNPLAFRSFDLATYTSTGYYTLPMNNDPILELLRFGPSGLVVRSSQSVYVVPNAPGL